MRIMVMFDLPTITSAERRDYRRFRKFLMKNGFLMMQESVYTKLALNTGMSDALMNSIMKNRPAAGLVQAMIVTEKQFNKMILIVGETKSEVLDSDERLVIL